LISEKCCLFNNSLVRSCPLLLVRIVLHLAFLIIFLSFPNSRLSMLISLYLMDVFAANPIQFCCRLCFSFSVTNLVKQLPICDSSCLTDARTLSYCSVFFIDHIDSYLSINHSTFFQSYALHFSEH